eukprot:gene36552-49250_t
MNFRRARAAASSAVALPAAGSVYAAPRSSTRFAFAVSLALLASAVAPASALEIVSEPDMRSSAEAAEYAKTLHALVVWLGICDGNMQEGSFRCDANVSVRKPGMPYGTRREIKNLNSFKFMQQAIDYEIRWQIEQIEDGHAIQQATVLFDPDTGETRAMRTKEDAADYRYFPDPDLPPLHISEQWVQEERAQMAELPRTMAARFVADYGLPEYDATTLTQSKAMAAYFEAAAKACGQPKLASNWIMGEISRRLNADEGNMDSVPVSAAQLAALIGRIADGTVSSFEVSDSNNDASQQINQIRAFIDKKCSIITSIPGSATALDDAIDAAAKAGIPFLTAAGSVTSPNAVNVDSNYARWGYDMMTAIGKSLPDGGSLLLVEGIAGHPIVVQERQGADKALAENSKLKIARNVNGNWTANVTKTVVLQAIATNPAPIDAVWTTGSESRVVAEAFSEAGRPAPLITGSITGDAL